MVEREIVFKDYDVSGLELFEVIVANPPSGKQVIIPNFEKLPEELNEYQAEAVADLLKAACKEMVPF